MARNARTKKLKIAIIAIALLLCLALAIGITTAFYQARRAVKGVVVFDQGIKFTITEVQDDSENNKGPYQLQYYSNKVVDDTEGNKIVLDTNVLPGEVLYVAIPTVNPASDTVPFALRAKLSYIYKDAEGQALDINSLTARQALFQTLYDGNSAIDFGNNWLYDTTTDYFYYVNNESNGLKLSNIAKITGETSPFGVFNDNLSGASKLEMNQDFGDIEAGGPIVEGHEIRTVEIVLDLEFIQYVEQSIIDIWGDSSVVVDENGVLTSATGFLVDEVIVPEVVDGKTVTQVGYGDTSATINAQNLVLPQTVTKIAAFSFPETTKDMTVRFDSSSTLSSGASFRVSTLDGETTYDLSIGAGAFAGCPNLIVSIPSGKTYKIANNAFDDSAKILVGDSNVARNWSEIKNNAASYGITLFEPSVGTERSNNSTSSNNYFLVDGATESVSNDGLWGYSSYKNDAQIADAPERAVVINYCNIHSGTVTVPKYIGNDLDGLYPVVGVKSARYYYLAGHSSTHNYLPVFTGEFDQIIFSEGIIFVDNLIVGTLFDGETFKDCKTSTCTSFVIPSTLTLLEENRASACEEEYSCKEYIVSDSNPKFKSEDGVLYVKDTKALLKYPKLKEDLSFTIPSWVEKILTTEGFNQNNFLKTLTINENVKEIGSDLRNPIMEEYGFNGNYTLNYNTNAYFISSDVPKKFNWITTHHPRSPYEPIANLNIGDNVTTFTVDDDALKYGASLNIGKNVTDMQISSSVIRTIVYADIAVLNVNISSENSVITKDSNNIIYNNQTGKMYFACSDISGDFTIPSYITTISEKAFLNFERLNSITIPSQVVSIDSQAFSGCDVLTNVTFSEGLISIEEYAFSGCNQLETITIPSTVESLGRYAFRGCDSLTTVNLLEGSLKELNGFYGCTSLVTISIPSTIESLGRGAFENCTGLKNIIWSEGLKIIDCGAFYGCTGLENINLPDSVEIIKSSAFQACTNLQSINLSANLKELGSVDNYRYVTDTTLTDGRGWVFAGCTNLESITIPNSTKIIGGCNFYQCVNLQSINLPESIETINKSEFNGCTSLTTINLPEGLISIEGYAFSGCSGLTSVIIPSTVTSIGNYAFRNCTNLADVKYAISYDLNGVEADPIERSFASATLNASGGLDGKVTTEITLPAAPTNATRTFLGWFDGSEIKAAGSTCTPARRKIIAAWEGLLPKYVVTLDANGGTGTYTIEVEPGSSFVFPDFTGFKNESGFPYEWRSTATYVNGTTKCYSPGASITPTTDMTFFVYYISSAHAAGGIQGRQGYTPEYILSKENPNYGDSIEVTFEIPSKFKISQIRYSVDNMQNYTVVERQYPLCGETITVTIDKMTYYIIYFQFDIADEYAEFIFDYEREGIEPVTIGGWLNDSSYKFVAPSSMVLDGQSIKGWEKRNVSYPPFIPSGSEFTPYTNERTAGTYYAVWEDARIVSGSALTKKGKEEDLRLEEEFMRAYYDLMNKAYSGDYTSEEINAMQQEFMQSDLYIRYMGVDSVSYNAYVSGLVKSGDVYITCDSALLKTEAYQVTGSDAGYAIELYEVLMRYTNAEDINTYEYLYLKCTKGVDGEGNTIFFRNETTNSCAGQYMGMQLYICLSWEVNVTINNGIDGEEPTTLQLHNGDKIPFPTLSKEGYIFGGWSLTENGSIDVSVDSAQNQYVNFHDDRTYYPVFYKEVVIAFDLNGGEGTLPGPVTTAKGRTISLPSVGDITKENYEFKGWTLVNEEGTELITYQAGDNYTFNYTGENFTLKAKWQYDGIIYYSDSSKSESITSGKVTWENGAYLASGKEFSKDGRVVIGWSETPDAADPTYEIYFMGSDCEYSELYAVYADLKDVVQINIDFSGIDVTSLGFKETDINYGIFYNGAMYVNPNFIYSEYYWKEQEEEEYNWFKFEKGSYVEALNAYKGQTITILNNIFVEEQMRG